jgi:hypothetical protein
VNCVNPLHDIARSFRNFANVFVIERIFVLSNVDIKFFENSERDVIYIDVYKALHEGFLH